MCTAIKLASNEGYVLGRTMDFEAPLVFNGFFTPRDYKYAVDLEGRDLISKYKCLGVVFYNTIPIKDGINEHGLSGSTNYYHSMNNHSNELIPGKKNISSLHYLNYALMNYKDIDELVADLDNIHISQVNSKGQKIVCPDFHHMFVDARGRCVVVEPKNKKYIYYDNPYGVMTNSPSFPSHVRRLEETINLDDLDGFNGAKNLPGGYDPYSRFIKAFYLSQTQLEMPSQVQAIHSAYNVLEAVSLPRGFIYSRADQHHNYTRYITVYDTKNKLMAGKSFSNPTVYYIGIDDFQEDRAQFFEFDMDLNMVKFEI